MQTMFEVSQETVALVERLLAVPVTGDIGYGELSDIAKANVQSSKGRGRLASARRILLREHGAVFSAVQNVGMHRLDDTAKIASGQDSLRRIRGTARRGDHRVAAGLRSNSLSSEQRAIGNGYRAVFAMINNLAKVQMVKSVATNTEDTATVKAGRLEAVQV